MSFLDEMITNWCIKFRVWRVPQMCENISKKYGGIVYFNLFGKKIWIITDHEIAKKLMRKHGKHLVQRTGNDEGLKILNMKDNGIIWNNNESWYSNREIFEECINNGTKNIEVLSKNYFENVIQIPIARKFILLDVIRKFTIEMTLKALFEINNYSEEWKQKAIKIVQNYFSAWEFFLLTPNTSYWETERKTYKVLY